MSAILSQEEIDRLAGSISDSLTEEPSANGKGVLSQEEINRITNSLGIDDDVEMKEDEPPDATMPAVLSQEEIDKLASPEPSVSNGGTLSQEEIDRLSSMDSEPAEPPPSGGGMLTQEEIDRLSSIDSEPAEPPPSGGGMLTQEEIDRLSSIDSEPAEPPPSGGGMLSQEEIDRLSSMDSEPAEPPSSGGGMLSQEEIDRLSSMDSEPAEPPSSGGGMLSQEEIDRLSSMDSEPAEPPSGGGMLSQEEIDRLSSMDNGPVDPSPSGGGMLSQEEIDKLSTSGNEESVGDTPVPVEALSQEELDRLSVMDGEESPEVEGAAKASSEVGGDTPSDSDKSRFPFNINSKMLVLIGVPLLVVTGLTFLIIQIFFSDPQPSVTPVESGFTKVPVDTIKKKTDTDDLLKGVNLFVDSIARDGIEATVDKSKELFYAHKLQGTEDTLKKSFAFDLSASLVLPEGTGRLADRFSIKEMRKRFVPAIRKSNAVDDLKAETVIFDWGRAVIKDLKIKKRDELKVK